MIPKIIHCFWAGGPKTKLAEKCLASWRKFAPDWEIREWTLGGEGGFEVLRFGSLDANSNPPNIQTSKHLTLQTSKLPDFVRDAVATRKWAFVSDWVRFAVLKEHGGVYFDFDQELIRPLNLLPDGEWCAGENTVSGGCGFAPGAGLALEVGSAIAAAMLDYYSKATFSSVTVGEIMGRLAAARQLRILEPDVMCPIGFDGKMRRTERTVGIHWYAMSWASPRRKLTRWLSWHGFRWLVDAVLRLKGRR